MRNRNALTPGEGFLLALVYALFLYAILHLPA